MNADTSSQPDGITRRALLNIFEALFRRPWLHGLPLFLLLALGATSALGGEDKFQSVGTLSVTNESLLSDLTDANDTGFGFETPATVTARQINELLRVGEFFDNVLERAGLDDLVSSNALVRSELTTSTSALADGDSIVRVATTTRDPELSRRLADATIVSYRQWLVDSYVTQSTSAVRSLTARVGERQAGVDEATTAVTAFIELNPNSAIEDRIPADQLEYARLTAELDRAQTKLEEAEDALDAAVLQSAQAADVVDQRVQVLDEPSQPFAPQGRLRKAALTMVLFGTIGVLLSIASVVVAAMLDRTIRVPDDVTAKFGLDVLAIIPNRAR